jgi:amidohydrolase
MQEEKTAEKVASRLRALGYEVTSGIGGTGVVGLLRNGPGPTVMLRADMDALPIEEKTGLPYESKATMVNRAGKAVPVAHSCGHDLHSSCLVGVANLLSQAKGAWSGTLMTVAQPGEETMEGARAMLNDGLFSRFPRPDVAIAQHTWPIQVGKIGYVVGPMGTNVDNLRIRVFGRGAHGAMPHLGVDPIVIAAATVLRLQTVVSRAVEPGELAIVTVGSLHGGTQYNIIPDDAELEVTVRTEKEGIRKQVLEAIRRIANAEAAASNASREPEISVIQSAPITYTDEEPTTRILKTFRRCFGADSVVPMPPLRGSEDFSLYGRVPGGAGVPSVFYFVGIANQQLLEERRGDVPSAHSPRYAPDREPSLRMGLRALTLAALTMLGRPGNRGGPGES